MTSTRTSKGHVMGTHGLLTMYVQIRERICLMQQRRKQNKDGLSRNQNSTIPTSEREKVGRSDASSNALQNTDKEQWRCPPQHWETQDKICLHC